VFEVTFSGQHHGDAGGLGSGDRLVVFNRSTRLDDSPNPGPGGDLDTIGIGKKAITCQHCAQGAVAGPMHGQLDGFHPVHLTGTYSYRGALVGEHDFSAFRAAECQARTPVRRVESLSVERYQERIVIEATANAFLHHMVRNIAGLLIAVGKGKAPPEWAHEVLAGRDRTRSAATAPACGLYLWSVRYPAAFGLPVVLAYQAWTYWVFRRRLVAQARGLLVEGQIVARNVRERDGRGNGGCRGRLPTPCEARPS